MKTITASKIVRAGGIFMLILFLAIATTFSVINHGSITKIIPIIIFGLFFCGIILFMIKRSNKSIEVLETGHHAMVTILEIKDREGKNLVKKDDFVWMLLRMRIEIKGKQPYEIEQKQTFPRLGSGYVKPGVVIPAMIAQEDANKIEFLWIEFTRSMQH